MMSSAWQGKNENVPGTWVFVFQPIGATDHILTTQRADDRVEVSVRPLGLVPNAAVHMGATLRIDALFMDGWHPSDQ